MAGARLAQCLDSMPVVVLSGMRQAGKSTLLREDPRFRDRRYLTLDDFGVLEAAKLDPDSLLSGDAPLTLDEVQRAPELLVALKKRVDRDRTPGRYLLSGSADLALLRGVTESLAGRAVYLQLFPLTHHELMAADAAEAIPETSGKRPSRRRPTPARRPWLVDFLEAGSPPDPPPGAARSLAWERVRAGGFPSVALGKVQDPEVWFTGYQQTYLERDLRELSAIPDLIAVRRLMRLSALRSGSLLNVSELGRDAHLKAQTTRRYLDLLETSFLVSPLSPYLGNRASRLVKSPKLYWSDSGLAGSVAGIGSLAPGIDEPLRGAMLETHVLQNLQALLQAWRPRATVHYWHVQGRHEVDFVIEDGRTVTAIEVKAASRVERSDLKGIQAFLAATPACRTAVLAYQGEQVVPLGDRIWAIPLGLLLS